MRVNLPVPPAGAGRFISNLVSQLTAIFRKIRPASGWKNEEAPLYAAKGGGAVNAPSWDAFQNGIYAYAFSASQLRELWVSYTLPHDLALSYTDAEGASTPAKIYPAFHWASAGTDTGTVRFGIEWTYAKGCGNEVFGSTQTFYIEKASDGTANKHCIAGVDEASAISSAEFEMEGMLLMRIFRDGAHANDTLTDKAFIFSVSMLYLSDGLLTTERNRGPASKPWTKQSVL